MLVTNTPRVFLFVTIPTHLRVLMEVADLLRSSSRYQPVLVYYPSAVFDQNHENCQYASHDTYLWSQGRFLSKEDYLYGHSTSEAPHPTPNRGLSSWLPNKGIYRGLRRFLPFLPHPTSITPIIGSCFYIIAPTVRFLAGACSVFKALIINFLSFTWPSFNRRTVYLNAKKRNWLQRFLLTSFAQEWDASSKKFTHTKICILQRLIRLFTEGLFTGLNEQCEFFEAADTFIKQQKVNLVVLPEANLFYNSHYLIHAAHSNNVPVAIVPFTIVNTLEWAEAFFDVSIYHANKGWNRLFAKAFPFWVLKHRGRDLILPPVTILACELFNIVPDIPWLINSSDADAIAAESQFMSDYYMRAGIKRNKIRFTGSLSDDRIFSLLSQRDYYRKELELRCNISLTERIVLIGLPPDQFGGGKRQGCEFDNHEELIRFMIDTVKELSDERTTILINLHPRIKYNNTSILSTYQAMIINEPIEHLVPLADVYIAVASATIRLGMSCGIPVVNYDAYQYNYDDYKGQPGICEAKSKQEYRSFIDAILNDPTTYCKLQKAQMKVASNSCQVDGKAGERLLNLFDELSAVN